MLSNLDTAWRYPLALLLGLLTGLYIGGMLATIYVMTAFRESLDTLSPIGPWFLRYAWADDVTFETAQSEVTIPGVASILRAMVSNDPNGAVARRIETRRSPRVGGLRGQGLASQGAAQNGLMDASYVDGGSAEEGL